MQLLIKLKEIWRYHQLLYFLTLRDIKVRYKQAVFGIGWAILSPAALALVFWLVFGVFLNVSSGPVPYLLLVFSKLTFWNFFSQSVSGSSTALTSNANLIIKSAFPREILIFSSTLVRIIDLAASLAIMAILMAAYGFGFSLQTIWLIPILLIESLLIIGLSLIFSSLNVYFRDIGAFLPLLMTLWLFLTPVIYTLDTIPPQFKILLLINPMTGIIESVRLSLLLKSPPDFLALSFSLIISLGTLIFGCLLFKKLEKGFADII